MYAGRSLLAKASKALEDFSSRSGLAVSWAELVVKSKPSSGSNPSAIALTYAIAFKAFSASR